MLGTLARISSIALACLTVNSGVDANSTGAKLQFEVASIRLAAPMPAGRMTVGSQGGPGTSDPSRITYTNMTLTYLLLRAYDVKPSQITGGPSWLDKDSFDIDVKVPAGATRAEVRVMLQNLLADRFKLVVHRESREMPTYALVLSNGGPKMQEHAADAPPPGPPLGPSTPTEMRPRTDGCPDLSLMKDRPGSIMAIANGAACVASSGQTMAQLTDTLANQLDRPVVDMTGLKGKYDFLLRYDSTSAGKGITIMTGMSPGALDAGVAPDPTAVIPAQPDRGPTVFAALQQQLGLKLESRKGPVDLVVVDRVVRTPTEN